MFLGFHSSNTRRTIRLPYVFECFRGFDCVLLFIVLVVKARRGPRFIFKKHEDIYDGQEYDPDETGVDDHKPDLL